MVSSRLFVVAVVGVLAVETFLSSSPPSSPPEFRYATIK
jgi:hypothetical protein